MRRAQRGITLLELLAAIAIGSLMAAGLVTLIDNALEDSKGQQAALYQSQIVAAASKYVARNYSAVAAIATAATPAKINLDALKFEKLLPDNFATANSYGQQPCVLVLQPEPERFNVLVVTEGGTPIPERQLAYIAANSGQGGGYIPQSAPTTARGSSFSPITITSYVSANCSGTAAAGGHLASALFFDGPSNLPADFLYRNTVNGKPELNAMTAALHMKKVVVENDTTDPLCQASDPTSNGRIAVDSTGAVMSCRSGRWQRQPGSYWREPVASYAALPAVGNTAGDVRMTLDVSRAFTWNGAAWVPLAIDQNGNLTIPGTLRLDTVVVKGTPCAGHPAGAVARDASGMLMSCQAGIWQSQSMLEVGHEDHSCQQIRPSKHGVYEPECTEHYPQANIQYSPLVDTYSALIVRNIPITKSGMISVNVWTHMSRGSYLDPTVSGQAALYVTLINNDDNKPIANSQTQTPRLVNDSAGLTIDLVKPVPKNNNGYRLEIVTAYTLFDGGAMPFDESSFMSSESSVVQQTPLKTGWNIDVIY